MTKGEDRRIEMRPARHADLLDTVLTLRGHQITLRQALAEGLVKGLEGRDHDRTELAPMDPRWLLAPDKQVDAA
jgi:hypothetical protein